MYLARPTLQSSAAWTPPLSGGQIVDAGFEVWLAGGVGWWVLSRFCSVRSFRLDGGDSGWS